MRLIIEDDEGKKTTVPLVRDEVTIGRRDGNTIRLTERNISRRHARLVREAGAVYVEDLTSFNGVRVNGDRIESRAVIKVGDRVEIGDYELHLEGDGRVDEDTQPAYVMNSRLRVDPLPEAGPAAGHPHAPGSGGAGMSQETSPEITAPGMGPSPLTLMRPAGASPIQAVQGRSGQNDSTAVIRLADPARVSLPTEETELPGRDHVRLVGQSPAVRGQVHVLSRNVVRFGRTSDGNQLVLDHVSISRNHGRFQRDADGWRVIDQNSANGVRVNGDSYGVSPIRPGDLIELGHLTFRFLMSEETEDLRPPLSPAGVGRAADWQGKSPAGRSRLMWVGAVAGVVAAGVGLFWVSSTGARADGEAGCSEFEAAASRSDWTRAAAALDKLEAADSSCAFSLGAARAKVDAGILLVRARQQTEAGAFLDAIATLDAMGSVNPLSVEARLARSEALSQAVRQWSEQASTAIQKGQSAVADKLIRQIADLDPQDPSIVLLRQNLADRQRLSAMKGLEEPAAQPAPKVASPSRPVEKTPEKAAPKVSAPSRPVSDPKSGTVDRASVARAKIEEARRLIGASDLSGAVALFQEVIAEEPPPEEKATAFVGLGIVYNRLGKPDEAERYYRLHLQLQPNSMYRERIEKFIAERRAAAGN